MCEADLALGVGGGSVGRWYFISHTGDAPISHFRPWEAQADTKLVACVRLDYVMGVTQ